MKRLVCLLMFMVFQTASSYEIEFSRTFNKVLVDNNQLQVKMNSEGMIEVIYPEFYQVGKQLNFKASTPKLAVIDELVEKVDRQVTATMLKNKLNVLKRNHNLPLFYSSDVDQISLKITDEKGQIWSISLDNLTELKQHYELMGKWQPMIDLITEIQSWSQQAYKLQQQGAGL